MVVVKLFAVLRKIAGKETIELNIEDKISFKELLDKISSEVPEIANLIGDRKVMVSVNQEIADDNTTVKSGDEVAVLPPFAGGSADSSSSLIRVQEGDFSVGDEVERVLKASKTIGGVVTFLGTVRDLSKGKDIEDVTFEHYPGMAEKKLGEIRERALKDFDIIEMSIIHRVGVVIPTGGQIVLIVVGAKHRRAAFEACSWAIDELKQITPIWKKEKTSEGDVWVEEHP